MPYNLFSMSYEQLLNIGNGLTRATQLNTVYNSILNSKTKNFNGLEWVVDGSMGRVNYPGTYPEEFCTRLYRAGIPWDIVLRAYNRERE